MTPAAKEHLTAATRAMEAAIDAAYEAGKRAGIDIGTEQERERVRKALFVDADIAAVAREPAPKGTATPTPLAFAAGTLTNMARMMLAKDRKRTFSVDSVIKYFDEQYRTKVSADQVRALLKVMTRNEEAQRVERGVYTAGPRLEVQT